VLRATEQRLRNAQARFASARTGGASQGKIAATEAGYTLSPHFSGRSLFIFHLYDGCCDGGACRHEILPQAAQASLTRAAQWGAA